MVTELSASTAIVIAAIAPTLMGLAAILTAYFQGQALKSKVVEQAKITDDKIAANTEVTLKIEEKADHIVDVSNSNLTIVKDDLKDAKLQIKNLEVLVASLVPLIKSNGKEPPVQPV